MSTSRGKGAFRGGRGGRGGNRPERKQTPREDWETYDFSISFNPKTMKDKNPNAEFQALLMEMMKKAPGITFHPTNEAMYPKPSSFTTIQGYPKTEADFKDFYEVYENKGLTIYKIFVKTTMQYNELELRNSLMNYLRGNNLWMSSELISESVDEMIGYINYGHDKMVWRPDCEKKINNGMKALIQSESIPEALRLKIQGLKKGIHVRVATGTVRGGTRNEPVMCEGLVLRTTKVQARACIELLGLLDDNILGDFYSIVPRGVDKELGPQMYGDYLRANNDMLNTIRAIAVVNWPEELFYETYNPALGVTGTVAKQVDKLLLDAWHCVAIERTMETTTRGKYLLLFREQDMEKAKESIGKLIEDFGRASDRKCAKLALEKYNEYPEFDSIQRISSSVHSKGLRIRAMLEAAAGKRPIRTAKKIPQQQKFHFFDVPQELQKQPLPNQTPTYSNIVTNQNTTTKKQTMIAQSTPQQKTQPNLRQQSQLTQTTLLSTQASPDARTVATANSGLSDQHTIATMMTQITTQFSEMERDRIMREDRNEMKRQERETKAEEKREERDARMEEIRLQTDTRMEEIRLETESKMKQAEVQRNERETRMEEKRLEAETKMYSFMQTMMTFNINKNINQGQVPATLTTGTTEQTSALTNSIATTNTATSSEKRPLSQLSNDNEETEMKDASTVIETTETEEESSPIKRNKPLTGSEEVGNEESTNNDMELVIEKDDPTSNSEIKQKDTGSFTEGFNNQQFTSTEAITPRTGVNQQ